MREQRGPTPEDVGRLVRWAIMIFFAYSLVVNAPKIGIGSSPAPSKQEPHPAPSTATKEKDCEQGSIFSNFSLFAMPLHPRSSPSIATSELTEGTGDGATCGQHATLRYSYSTRGGQVIFSNMDEKGEPSKDVLIGGGEVLKGLERGLVGMKTGGERDITMAPALGFYSGLDLATLRDHEHFQFAGNSEVITARAKLLSVSPPIPSSHFQLRQLEQQLGSDGDPLQCGDKARIILSLWKTDGTLLYSSEGKSPLEFQIGKSQVPYGIEQGIIGMSAGTKRTLLMPPEWMVPLRADAPNQLLSDVNIPPHEIILATVQALGEPAPATKN